MNNVSTMCKQNKALLAHEAIIIDASYALTLIFKAEINKRKHELTPSKHTDSNDDADYFATQGLHERDMRHKYLRTYSQANLE